MCGRYSLDTPLPRIVEHFGLDHTPELFARYNIAPSHSVPAVRATDGGRELIMLRWGLPPSWAKDEKIA
jgi:putative SOS response-associated peptidase YedK